MANEIYGKDYESPLTYQEERFVNARVEGLSLVDAYLLAYPHMIKYTTQTVRKHAKEMEKRSDIREARKLAEKEYNQSLATMSEWNRDLAVHSFRFVINQGMQDINNARVGKEMSLAHLTDVMEELQEEITALEAADDLSAVSSRLEMAKQQLVMYYQDYLELKGQRISDRSTNDAIIRAASELNKMMGIDGTTVDDVSEIKFIGGDRLED